ncbi:N-acetylglucosamine-6-phosphate deacetylase [Devosia sp. ZB163]|uniref:N-acetylglucosamine-6-phosphate deacetylase n=1 Tax=Devosia sp. ZB163 TaxID=3025938 RepID=UPI002360EE72|nr:N-acetylglucosamine-6-phosphate deacetylase [Devosia sp. ZB163]MDC9824124.1 N-acetylglucosamine-6-phosphate deacetylase [Devosia sp. ZB163]
MTRQAITGARIFDGAEWHDRMALVIEDGKVEGLIAADSPTDAIRVPADGAMIVPGFLDLQINGGGGALLNETPTVEAIRTICTTFAQFGTTACLPTIVTDSVPVNEATIAAGIAAVEQGVPGFLGLHLEGPHLAVSRKGAHDPKLIRPMDESDLQRIVEARRRLPNLLITVAAETVGLEQISRLAAAGVTVSIGHSDGTYAQVKAAAEAGATMVTHLFNAQSQIGNREPGVVGAALDLPSLSAGLIADGIHVHPASIGIALRAKRGPGRIFLVTDAMSITGTDWTEFELTGQMAYRKDGALRLADGTLAGADLTMVDAIRYMHGTVGLSLDEVLRMASLYPAQALRIEATYGHLQRGARADFAILADDLAVRSTWIGGEKRFG